MLLLSGKFCSSNVGCSGNYDWLLQAAKCAASRFCSATFLRQRFGYSVSLCKVSRFFSFFHGICPHLKYWRDSKVLTFNRKLFLVKVYRTLWFKLVVSCSVPLLALSLDMIVSLSTYHKFTPDLTDFSICESDKHNWAEEVNVSTW